MQLTSILTCFEMISKTQISFKNFRVCSLFFWSEFFFRKISPNFEFSKKKPIFFLLEMCKNMQWAVLNIKFLIFRFWSVWPTWKLKILRKKSKHSKKSNILHCLGHIRDNCPKTALFSPFKWKTCIFGMSKNWLLGVSTWFAKAETSPIWSARYSEHFCQL